MRQHSPPIPTDIRGFIDDDVDQLIMTTLNATVADVGQSAATSQGIIVIIIIIIKLCYNSLHANISICVDGIIQTQ